MTNKHLIMPQKQPSWCYKKADVYNLQNVQEELRTVLPRYDNGSISFSIIWKKQIQKSLPLTTKMLSDMNIIERWSHVILVKMQDDKWTPHIDWHDWREQCFSLNIPLQNVGGTFTAFYRAKIIEKRPEKSEHRKGTGETHRMVDPKTAEEICRVDADQPLWINTSIPHTPIVDHDKLRINACFRFNPELHDFFEDGTIP
jgi:hypothetical protein